MQEEAHKEDFEEQRELKRQEPSPHAGLIRNEYGRVFFFVTAGLSALLAVLMLVKVLTSKASVWMALAGVCALGMAALLVACTASAPFFSNRMLTGSLGVVMVIGSTLALMAGSQGFRFGVVVATLIQGGMAAVLALVPVDSPAALLLLPWVSKSLIYTKSSGHPQVSTPESTTATPNNEHSDAHAHTRQIRYRTVSVFHDWPAPIPFPATAVYSYKAGSPSELTFAKHTPLIILDCRGQWWQARDPATNQIGFVPSNFISVTQRARVVRDKQASADDELDVVEGQTVEVMEVHEAACLCRGVDGRIGSVPSDHLSLVNQ